jgi:4-amino-4-deoxy-L-arabinose transferase-like glycosyltransferase
LKRITKNSWWTFAFLLVALAYFFGLFIDLTGDSGLYAAISRQMVESGNWFNLKINGNGYDQKPHLFFWLAGLGIRLFGNSNFAFKLFPFIYGGAGFYFTYRLGKQLFSDETGRWAALIVGTSQIYFLYFFDFHTDSVLQTGVVIALWQMAAYLQHKKWTNFIFGFWGVGLAMLSKGPVGAILPFFAVLLYLLVERDFRQLIQPKWLLGILIVFIVISPALVHLYNSFSFDGLKFYFITNNFGRISGSYAGSSTDYFFYLHTLLWAFLPWTIIVLAAIYSTVKYWFARNVDTKWSIYLLGSVIGLVLILSIAKGKAPNYFLIAIAPIAVIAANWLVQFRAIPVNTQRRFLFLLTVFVLIQVSFLIFVIFVFSENIIRIPMISLVVFLMVIFIKVITETQSFQKIILGSILITGALNLFLNVIVLPDLYSYQGPRQALKLYEANSSSKTQLYNLDLEEYSLFFYANQPVENIEDWDELKEAFSKPGAWIYTNEIDYKEMLFQNFPIDTVYRIPQRGMNRVNLKFLNPKTREQSLKTNFLVVSGEKNMQ